MLSGKDTQMACYVPDGDIPITIRWFFHGDPVSHTMGVTTVKLGARSSILNIESLTYGHSGSYTCVASNAAGEDQYSSELLIHGILKVLMLILFECGTWSLQIYLEIHNFFFPYAACCTYLPLLGCTLTLVSLFKPFSVLV